MSIYYFNYKLHTRRCNSSVIVTLDTVVDSKYHVYILCDILHIYTKPPGTPNYNASLIADDSISFVKDKSTILCRDKLNNRACRDTNCPYNYSRAELRKKQTNFNNISFKDDGPIRHQVSSLLEIEDPCYIYSNEVTHA